MRSFPLGMTLTGIAALLALLLGGAVFAAEPEAAADANTQDSPPLSAETASPSPRHGRLELRRQNTEKGTPEETTRTTLRLEVDMKGTVSRLRFDLPFPDEKTDFGGDPFQPRLGDVKVRAIFRSFKSGDTRLSSNIEMTFPTADSSVSGAGKYQVSAAVGSASGAPDFVLASGRHQLRFEWSIRQTVSIAGDADRKDINNTKPELGLRDTIGSRYWLKLTLKPTIDWIQDGKTGAVLELEGGWNASRDWRFSLKGGAGLWGDGTPGYYNHRVELVAGRAF
jgi:hypothetical protein